MGAVPKVIDPRKKERLLRLVRVFNYTVPQAQRYVGNVSRTTAERWVREAGGAKTLRSQREGGPPKG